MKLARLLCSVALAGAVFAPAAAADEPLLCPDDLLPHGVTDVAAPPATRSGFTSCGLNIASEDAAPAVSAPVWIVFDPATGEVMGTNGPHDRYLTGELARLVFIAVVLDNYQLDDVLANERTVAENLYTYLQGEIDSTVFEIEDVNGQASRWLAQLPITDTMINTVDLIMSSSPVDIARIVSNLWNNPHYQEFLAWQTTNFPSQLAAHPDAQMYYGFSNELGFTALTAVVDDKAVVFFDSTTPQADLTTLLTLNGMVGDLAPIAIETTIAPATQPAPTGFAVGGLVALLILGFTLRYFPDTKRQSAK